MPKFFGLRQMADIAGVNDESRPLRQRVDISDCAAQAAYDVGVRVLVEADVRVTDLDEGEVVFRSCRDHA